MPLKFDWNWPSDKGGVVICLIIFSIFSSDDHLVY